MASTYRCTMKSAEQEGAAGSNNVYIDLASDADAALFAANLELVFAADVVSVDSLVQHNYALPYPLGTVNQWRMVIRTANNNLAVQTERVYNVLDTASAAAFAAAYKALAGVGWVQPQYLTAQPTLIAIDSVNVATFSPGVSH